MYPCQNLRLNNLVANQNLKFIKTYSKFWLLGSWQARVEIAKNLSETSIRKLIITLYSAVNEVMII